MLHLLQMALLFCMLLLSPSASTLRNNNFNDNLWLAPHSGVTGIQHLFGRDACSDAFGANSSDATCAPSFTLCCVTSGQTYPSCQQFLDKGWCCVGSGENDNCYVDQDSVCDETDSVPCTELAAGVDQACCPKLTSCATGYNASADFVRCNILYPDLVKAAASSTSSSSTTTTTTTSSSSSSSASSTTGSVSKISSAQTTSTTLTTTSTAPTTSLSVNGAPDQNQPSSGLSSGGIAGVVVGSIAGVAAIVAISWYFWRRRIPRTSEAVYHPTNTQDHPYRDDIAPKFDPVGTPQNPAEIYSSRNPAAVYELDGINSHNR